MCSSDKKKAMELYRNIQNKDAIEVSAGAGTKIQHYSRTSLHGSGITYLSLLPHT